MHASCSGKATRQSMPAAGEVSAIPKYGNRRDGCGASGEAAGTGSVCRGGDQRWEGAWGGLPGVLGQPMRSGSVSQELGSCEGCGLRGFRGRLQTRMEGSLTSRQA